MSIRIRRARLVALPIVAALSVTPLAAFVRAPTAPARYDWQGRYQLVGHDFPDGDRHAIAVVERLPSGNLTLRFEQGPPGALLGIDADGDSLHVDWMIATQGRAEPMEVHLAAFGDSLSGHWAMREGHVGGAIEGRRLR